MLQKFSIVLILLFGSAIAHGANDYCFYRDWLEQKTATGDWNGRRDQQEECGVTISSTYTTDITGNPVGGLKKSTIYSGFLDLSIALDFEKLACIKGLALTNTHYLASGQNLSASIGNFYGVQEVYTPGSYYFGVLDLSLSIFDDKLTFEIGRLFAGDVFVRSELWQYYLTSGLNGNLESIETNILFPNYNYTAWAARATYEPNKNWQLIGAIYNANPKVVDPNRYGLDFRLSMEDGYMALGQITYKHHQKREENGHPGSIAFGSYYQSSKFQNLADPTKFQRGNYGLYLIFDQMVFRGDWLEFEGPSYLRSGATYAKSVKHPYHQQTVVAKDHPQGLSVWGAAYLAPQEDINTILYQIAGGLVYRGLFPTRDRDVTVFCAIQGRFSDKLEGQSAETVLELNHRFQVGPWFYITPDVQYIIKPNGYSNIQNAWVGGIEMSVNF